MNVQKIGICDDDLRFMELFKEMLEEAWMEIEDEIPYEITIYQDSSVFLEKAKTGEFHLIFLDIEMPQLCGFEVADKLRSIAVESYIVFVSNEEKYVHDVFEYRSLAYIRKGKLRMDIEKELRIYRNEAFCKLGFQCTTQAGQKKKIPLKKLVAKKEIKYIEAVGHHITANTSIGSYQSHASLKETAIMLNNKDFIQIHRSYLVNKKYIVDIDRKKALIEGGDTLAVGRAYWVKVKEQLEL